MEPVRTRDFLWRSTVNFSTNKNTILELADGVEDYNLGGYDKLSIKAHVGAPSTPASRTRAARTTASSS